MTTREIKNLLIKYDCEDMPAERLECNYFADEVIMTYKWDKDISIEYKFTGCYRANFDHVKKYDKLRPVREMQRGHVPYFLQKIELGETEEDGVHFFTFDINMFPLYLEIWCQNVEIKEVPRWWPSEWNSETFAEVQEKWTNNQK